MRPATIEGNLSTAMYWRLYPLQGDLWLVCACPILYASPIGHGPGGEPLPNPDRRWLADLVHGEPYQPDGYDGPVFKEHRSPENEARVLRWRHALFDAVSNLGVSEEPGRSCWSLHERDVDALLGCLERRAAAGEFAA